MCRSKSTHRRQHGKIGKVGGGGGGGGGGGAGGLTHLHEHSTGDVFDDQIDFLMLRVVDHLLELDDMRRVQRAWPWAMWSHHHNLSPHNY